MARTCLYILASLHALVSKTTSAASKSLLSLPTTEVVASSHGLAPYSNLGRLHKELLQYYYDFARYLCYIHQFDRANIAQASAAVTHSHKSSNEPDATPRQLPPTPYGYTFQKISRAS
ncbi:hypothetical protein HBI38_042350 [Parastagonospora nodorum]|nr:hypothetical protein HBI10_009590 [Parastagonospora nodorum]KAH4023657.1 hypothetical protein HBI13_091300 [Parastagonospora nodorum]KAH4975348.1 hypothetical protein HBH73_043880 [Parastagonospora nodorum]KAH5110047.1 hypothetical protein HBH72_030200 [Parastagonospora nodorum]KAH5333221.1 hypothetical protein HBI50_053150 [Parastagonospora nodorum]